MGRLLDELNYAWFEDPIRTTDQEGLIQLCAALSLPIHVGEFIYSIADFAEYIKQDALDVVRLIADNVGGISGSDARGPAGGCAWAGMHAAQLGQCAGHGAALPCGAGAAELLVVRDAVPGGVCGPSVVQGQVPHRRGWLCAGADCAGTGLSHRSWMRLDNDDEADRPLDETASDSVKYESDVMQRKPSRREFLGTSAAAAAGVRLAFAALADPMGGRPVGGVKPADLPDLTIKEVKVYVTDLGNYHSLNGERGELISIVTNSGIEGNYTLGNRNPTAGWLEWAKPALVGKSVIDLLPMLTSTSGMQGTVWVQRRSLRRAGRRVAVPAGRVRSTGGAGGRATARLSIRRRRRRARVDPRGRRTWPN